MFQPGHAKVGGRKKGTPNKTSATVRELLAAEGIDPIQKILREVEQLLSPMDRIYVWLKILPYTYPQLKSVEISGDPDAPIGVTPSNVAALWAVARQEAMKHAATAGEDTAG